MEKKYWVGVAVLCTLTMTEGCSQASTAPVIQKPSTGFNRPTSSSYVVKAPGEGDKAIRRIFAEYGVSFVQLLENEQFEVRLDRDPGLDVLKGLAASSGGAVTAVQPNFVYHSN
jgi:hypothetical protein